MSIKARKPGDGKSTGSKSYAANLTDSTQVNPYFQESHPATTIPTSKRTRTEAGRHAIYSDLGRSAKRITGTICYPHLVKNGARELSLDGVIFGAREFSPVKNGAKLLFFTGYSLRVKLPKGSAYANRRRTKVLPALNAGASREQAPPLCLQDSDSEHRIFATEVRS